MVFENRTDAGRRLAELLGGYREEDVVVLALPRGGVVVAAEVARALHAPLDLAVAKKIGHPMNPEAAIGAVSEDGVRMLDPRAESSLDHVWLEKETLEKSGEAARLRERYTGSSSPPTLSGRTVILVDDGIATGYTMMAAVESARRRGSKRVVVAVPVAPSETLNRLRSMADDAIGVDTPEHLYAVGAHYEDFRQVTDEEVIDILGSSR